MAAVTGRGDRWADRATREGLLAPLEPFGVLQAIDGAHDGTPGIRTRHLPGHTPGHQVVHVEDGGASLLSGDAIKPSGTVAGALVGDRAR